MARVWCMGSINVDMFYDVPHIPAPGETLASTNHSTGLGGKGANQSVAAARAGASVSHIGAVGEGGDWILNRLTAFGVNTDHISTSKEPTGHAIINVAEDGENAIVILAGANGAIAQPDLQKALEQAEPGDILLMQNETNMQEEAALAAKELGLRVFYSAAPFDSDAVKKVLPTIDTLLLNEIEAEQLQDSLRQSLFSLDVPHIVITLGGDGARWIDTSNHESFDVPAIKVTPVDTTGAGDTFAGYLAAALARGDEPREAMRLANRAAALKVTKKGTADAIPSLSEVENFMPG